MKVRFFDPGLGYKKLRPEIDFEIQRVLLAGDLILRKDVEVFEENLAAFVGTKYAVGLNSGTDALYLSLKAHGIGPGDEVITVSHTFIATIEEIVRVGATPVLIDIGDDYLMDTTQIEDAITEKTKAIIPVHLSGDVCNMPEIMAVADKYHLLVIEDAAQALGGAYAGVNAGAWGITGCFSFYPAKLLGSFGDGGAITTDDEELAKRLKLLRNHYYIGRGAPNDRVEWGMNSRLDNLQAAVLNVKFKYFREALADRKRIAEKYNDAFADLPLVTPTNRQGRVWQDYVIRSTDAADLAAHLTEKEVETLGVGLIANHDYNALRLDFYLPKTSVFTPEFIRLPCNENLTEEEINHVITSVRSFYV